MFFTFYSFEYILPKEKPKNALASYCSQSHLVILPYTNHCVYVMVTTSCLGDSLKNTRLRCDKPFLWTIIRCHAMKTSCIIATEHKYELNQYIWQAEFWIWDWTALKMEFKNCLWFHWYEIGSWKFLQISTTWASQGLGVHSVSEHKKRYIRNYT